MNGKLGAFYAKWVPYFAPGAAGGGAEAAEHSHEEHMIFMLYRAILEEALQGFAAESITTVALVTSLRPLFAALLEYLAFRDAPACEFLAGCALILAGFLLYAAPRAVRARTRFGGSFHCEAPQHSRVRKRISNSCWLRTGTLDSSAARKTPSIPTISRNAPTSQMRLMRFHESPRRS